MMNKILFTVQRERCVNFVLGEDTQVLLKIYFWFNGKNHYWWSQEIIFNENIKPCKMCGLGPKIHGASA